MAPVKQQEYDCYTHHLQVKAYDLVAYFLKLLYLSLGLSIDYLKK